jgi:tetratricopeptide (TPR) repeat protein
MLAAAALWSAETAHAQQSAARNSCDWKNTADDQIAGCTAIIESRGESQRNRVMAYNTRGNAWRSKGDLDRAMADFDQAIRLDPKFAGAYSNRGIVWSAKGDLDRAIADYDQAIRLDPKYANAYSNRGNVWRARGDLDRAIADYDQTIRLDPKLAPAYSNRGNAWKIKGDLDRAIADFDRAIRLAPKFVPAHRGRGEAHFLQADFSAAAADLLGANDIQESINGRLWNPLDDDLKAMLWRFLARGRMGQDGASELSASVARLRTKDWPYPVIDFYLGRRSLEDMRAAALDADDKCEAAFYAGEWRLLRGDKPAAKRELEGAAGTCPKTRVEYVGAVAELKRLAP